MTSRDLVGPMTPPHLVPPNLHPVVRFHDGTEITYDVPVNSLDPRYRACTEHRTACDCREAVLSEEVRELQAQIREARDAALQILAGHPIYAWTANPDGTQTDASCMCTGCQIVRAGHLVLYTDYLQHADHLRRTQNRATP